jgi:hemerythrin-like domain-containing protein
MPIQLGAAKAHGFDEPLDLLSDCHRRIENFLGVLRNVAGIAGVALNDRQREAVETSLTYFREAAPRHNQDEEQSLFPLLRRHSDPAVLAALKIIDSLEAEHIVAALSHREIDRLYRQWIDAGFLPAPERSQLIRVVDELIQMYQHHIALEDQNIFPLAGQVLGVDERGRLGREMAERRAIYRAASIRPPEGPVMTVKNTVTPRNEGAR